MAGFRQALLMLYLPDTNYPVVNNEKNVQLVDFVINFMLFFMCKRLQISFQCFKTSW